MECLMHFFQSNVKGYFPSLSTSTNTEDIEKLQSLIQERNHLKGKWIKIQFKFKTKQYIVYLYISDCYSDTLQKTNVTMRQQFSMVNSWHHNVKLLKDSHDEELKKFKNINDEVRFFCLIFMQALVLSIT